MPTMPSRPSAGAVDTRRDASLPLAPLDPPVEREQPAAPSPEPLAPDRRPDPGSGRRRPRLIVEPNRPAIVAVSHASTGGHLGVMPEYPVQVSKVQAPPLRDETLARDRLLEWLSVKIHRRAVMLIAEAGYGKTTLLADFSRRTRVRVLWFRLDRGDRDWVGFLAYLVAAVRIHVPDFGAATRALLRETATSAPPLEAVLDTFLRELGGLPNDATALVFDDFHLVDDSPDVRHILRELLARGPERMSFVFASRREPPIRLARLRALGEVAELGTDDLRFDPSETERLFRETYEMRLEPAILAELSRRTEGWAASLQLVRAALHERNPAQVRAFISSLSGAEGHLYEYLAEEVIGDLPPELQDFLMRTSLLETVDLVLGPVAAGVTEEQTRSFIEEGERHGLFGRGGPHTRHVARAHPLVRDFLLDRLLRSLGESGVRNIHLHVARAAERVDWRVSSRHYLASGSEDDAHRVLSGAIEAILATGAYATAQEIAASLNSGSLAGTAGLVLRSRIALQRASIREGLQLAEEAFANEPNSNVVLLSLATARTLAGDVQGALDASKLLEETGRTQLAEIGRVYRRTMECSTTGSLDLAAQELEELAVALRRRGDDHYLGVTLLNLSLIRTAMGEHAAGLAASDEAIGRLSSTSAGVELTSARLARATTLAYLGRMNDARAEMSSAVEVAQAGRTMELAIEVGQTEALLGDPNRAWPLMDRVSQELVTESDEGEQAVLARALLWIRAGDLPRASADVARLRHGVPRSTMAFEARRRLIEGLVGALEGNPEASMWIRSGTNLAREQGARLWADYGAAMSALVDGNAPSSVVNELSRNAVVLSMLAEVTLSRLADLTEDAREVVDAEAARRPWRWRDATRRMLSTGSPETKLAAAHLLEKIGEAEDVERLRDAGRAMRDRNVGRLGLALARRLADRVLVHDLGRVHISVGERAVDGAGVRRKVLALLCLLLSKPRLVATRDEVIDSLWPDQDPAPALNSLNQTVYFLRRVFEPAYRDETSPGYVGQDGETIWLDLELVSSSSRECASLIRSMPSEATPEGSIALANLYTGRFALDFAYEEWAAPHRDALHAAYLRVMERAVRSDIDSGHFSRGTFLAERAAEVDPEAEEIQAALVRLYRLSGAHAAAAEKYQHYSQAMRDLGVEPPAYSDV